MSPKDDGYILRKSGCTIFRAAIDTKEKYINTGFTDVQIGDMISKAMIQTGYSNSGVRKCLALSARHTEFSNVKKAVKSSALQGAEAYISQDLATYSKTYLIEIIHYLEQKLETSTQILPLPQKARIEGG